MFKTFWDIAANRMKLCNRENLIVLCERFDRKGSDISKMKTIWAAITRRLIS